MRFIDSDPHEPTSRRRPLSRLRRGVAGMALSLFVFALTIPPVGAALSEPEFTFYGTPTENGALLEQGVVTAVLAGTSSPIASFVLGSNREFGSRFVLRVPLVFLPPGDVRPPGTARPGEAVEFFIDGELAGTGVVGERGAVETVDLDIFFDDDPELSVADAEVVEGDTGTTDAGFEVSLSRPLAWDVSFDYATVDGTAVAPGDYVAVVDTGVIPAGERSVTVLVPVHGDEEAEPDETFGLAISNPLDDVASPQPIQTVLADAEALGTIGADDTRFVVNIDDVQVLEPDGGVQVAEAVFVVTVPSEIPPAPPAASRARTRAQSAMLEVDFETVDGTAVAGVDYVAASGRVAIDTGVACPTLSQPCIEIPVTVLGNTVQEEDKTFLVRLSNPSQGVIGDGEGQATILNDEHFLVFLERLREGEAGVMGLLGASAAAVSPDGAHLYATAGIGNALSVFERDVENGRLEFLLAIRDGEGGVDGLGGADSVAVSRDGATVYVAGYLDDALTVFERDSMTGLLTVLESHRQGVDGVVGLDGIASIATSADGLSVYAAGFNSDAVAIFARDAGTGALTFEEAVMDGAGGVSGLQGVSAVAVSPDGSHLYAAAAVDSALVTLERDPVTGLLTFLERQKDGLGGVDGLDGAAAVVVSPDGAHVYAVGQFDDAIAVFARETDSNSADHGKLTFIQRRRDGVGGVWGLDGVAAVAVSPTGEYVYTASQADSAVAVFDRDPATGVLAFIEARRNGDPDANGVPDETGTPRLDGLAGGVGLALSPLPPTVIGPPIDLGHVYVVGSADNALALFVNDTFAPDPPALSSPTHQPGVWSASAEVTIEWSGSDRGGAGLGGYSHHVDQHPATDPGIDLDQLHRPDVSPQSAVVGPLGDGTSHFFHLRACDRSDNCGEPAHLGPFWIDSTAPGPPTNLVGFNHANDNSADVDQRAISMTWAPAPDATSGLEGYSHVFDLNPTRDCPEVETLDADAVGVSSPAVPALTEGVWFFHLCAVDRAGNWGPVVDAGPFYVGLFAFAGEDQTIEFSESVELGETPSARGGMPPYTYAWSVDPPVGEPLLSSTTAANPIFSGDLVGTFSMSLVVSDSVGSVTPAEVEIRVDCPWPGAVDLFNVEVFGFAEETSYDWIVAEDYRVKAGAEAIFRAGERIELRDDFVVEEGASFSAFVDPSMACKWP